jgi:hypothetical protein
VIPVPAAARKRSRNGRNPYLSFSKNAWLIAVHLQGFSYSLRGEKKL